MDRAPTDETATGKLRPPNYLQRHKPGTFLFTSESVGEGHPDKMCDQISDAILDACLKEDPYSKVACESATKTGIIMVFGEITTTASVDYQAVVRETVKKIGYDDSSKGFDYETCGVIVSIEKQSPNIEQAVSESAAEDMGAGDQGMMCGYATNETKECMPMTIVLSHKLNKKLAQFRRDGTFPWVRPDSKSQVTMEYRIEGGECIPVRVHTVVISVQHSPDISLEEMRKQLKETLIKQTIPEKFLDEDTVYHLQPSGEFVIGGPKGDAGLTGRKIIVDTYGGWGGHGGGAFSGKDCSKVDRSGAYAARWVAKSIVAAGLAKRVFIQISYAIGVAEPLSIHVHTYNTSEKSEKELLEIINNNFDLRPGAIIRELELRKPIFQSTAVYGHFGRDEFPWEKPKDLKY